MAKPNYAFAKRQRDLAKKKKKEEKKARKLAEANGEVDAGLEATAEGEPGSEATPPAE